MDTVELLDASLAALDQAGYQVRMESMDGAGGGACEINGRKCLFLDLTLTPQEQLEQVVDALRQAAPVDDSAFPKALRDLIGLKPMSQQRAA